MLWPHLIGFLLVMLVLFPGKIFENLTLNPLKNDTSSPPSQPPTPPSTPLSPKSGDLPNNRTSSSSSSSTSSHNIPSIPNVTITQASSQNIPQNLSQKNNHSATHHPLNLGKKPKISFTNGTTTLSSAQSDFPYSSLELEAIRNKINEDRLAEQMNNISSGRVSIWRSD